MLLSVFKNKRFWVVWITLSLSGAFIGYSMLQARKAKLNNAEPAICEDFRKVDYPSIVAIDNLKYKDEYIKFLLDTNALYLNFPFRMFENKIEVKILDYAGDSSLVLVAIERDNPTKVQRYYEEVWIYERFVKQLTTKNDTTTTNKNYR